MCARLPARPTPRLASRQARAGLQQARRIVQRTLGNAVQPAEFTRRVRLLFRLGRRHSLSLGEILQCRVVRGDQCGLGRRELALRIDRARRDAGKRR